MPERTKALFSSPLPLGMASLEQVIDECRAEIMPYATGNVHPRFFGWVHGAGTPLGILSEMVAATMNSNCGGRDHGAVYVERQVIEWCRTIFGLPETSSGVLTVGTSMATVIALATAAIGARARVGKRPETVPPGLLVGYCSNEAHVADARRSSFWGLATKAFDV